MKLYTLLVAEHPMCAFQSVVLCAEEDKCNKKRVLDLLYIHTYQYD